MAKPKEFQDMKLKGRVRNKWEAGVARWLTKNDILWGYEVDFIKTPFGVYVPDFTLINVQEYVEVKGRVNNDVQTRKIDWVVAQGITVHVIDKTNIQNIALGRKWDEFRTTKEFARRVTA